MITGPSMRDCSLVTYYNFYSKHFCLRFSNKAHNSVGTISGPPNCLCFYDFNINKIQYNPYNQVSIYVVRNATRKRDSRGVAAFYKANTENGFCVLSGAKVN